MVQEQQEAPEEELLVVAQPDQVVGVQPGEVVSFLTTQRHVTQLALVHPPDDAVEALVVCVDETGATTLGVTDGEGVTYRGAAPEAILDRWRTWRDGREQTAGTDV